MLPRAVEHHVTSTVDGTRRSLPPRLHLDGLLQSQGADAAVAGDRPCHGVFDAQGGVGLVSSIAVNVVEVHQRNLPLSGLLFLSPNDGSAALPWSLVPTAVVRF